MTDQKRDHADDGWAFAKELSDALLKIRPLGGSELFVRRNGQFYADPKYCGDAITELHEKLHSVLRDLSAERKAHRAELASLCPGEAQLDNEGD